MPPQIPTVAVERYNQRPLALLNVVHVDTVDFRELVVEVLWIVGLLRRRELSVWTNLLPLLICVA